MYESFFIFILVTVGSDILAHQMTAMQQTDAFVIFMLASQTVNSVLLNTRNYVTHINYVISQHYSWRKRIFPQWSII